MGIQFNKVKRMNHSKDGTWFNATCFRSNYGAYIEYILGDKKVIIRYNTYSINGKRIKLHWDINDNIVVNI